jgi:SAM-dependent methyltransferase
VLRHLRYAATTLWLEDWWKRRRRLRTVSRRGGDHSGNCPICNATVQFLAISDSPREQLQCVGCGSVPRQRALILVLRELDLARLDAHESSPSLCTYWFLRRHCQSLEASYFWPDRRSGVRIGATRNVDLGKQPYGTASLDLVITQDVLEHVPDPNAALREIHRTLRPGGSHIFTVPRANWQATAARAQLLVSAQNRPELHHLKPPEYHRDPINKSGSLVFTDWGMDLEQRMAQAVPGVRCETRVIHDPTLGISHPVEVFVAHNPS